MFILILFYSKSNTISIDQVNKACLLDSSVKSVKLQKKNSKRIQSESTLPPQWKALELYQTFLPKLNNAIQCTITKMILFVI